MGRGGLERLIRRLLLSNYSSSGTPLLPLLEYHNSNHLFGVNALNGESRKRFPFARVPERQKKEGSYQPAKPILKGISIKEPIHSTQSNRPITRSRTAETLDKGNGKVVVEKEVPKKTLVTIVDSTKAEFLFEDNEQEATQLTRKRKATADPIPDAQVQEKALEFIHKPLQTGVTGFVSGVTSQAKAVIYGILTCFLS
ncbi:hypothetical protein AgCh_026892 [Apium graveolens]